MNVEHVASILPAQKGGVNRVCGASWVGDRLALANADRSISVFDSAGTRRDKFTAKPLDKENPEFVVTGLALDAAGQKLAVAQSDCIVFVYNLGSNHGDKKTICNKFPTDKAAVSAIAWANANTLLIATVDGKLKLGNLRTNKISDLANLNTNILAAAAAPNGENFAVVLGDSSVHVLASGGGSTRLGKFPGAEKISWSSGNLIAVASAEGKLHLLQPEGKEVAQFPIKQGAASLAFNSAGDAVAVGVTEGVELFVKAGTSWVSGNFPIKLRGFFRVTALAWSGDGTRLALGGVSGGAEVFEVSLARKSRKQGNTEIVFRTATEFQVRETGGKVLGNFRASEALTDAQVVKERFVVGHGENTLYLADTQTGSWSEIVWKFSEEDKFGFDYEGVVLGHREGELFVFELGRSEICGSVRTEFAFAEVVSCRVTDGGERVYVAFLQDAHSAGVFECVSGNFAASVTVQEAEIDWLELDVSGHRLLFRDKRRNLHILDVRSGQRSQLLQHCGFCQWVPASEVFVAQTGERLCVWYSVDALDKVTVKELGGASGAGRATVVEIERTGGRTVVVVEDERGTQTEYELDENLINFHTFLDNREYQQAAQALEQLPLTQETQTLWQRLGVAALSAETPSLALGERCFAEISDYAMARYVRKLRRQEKDERVVRAKLQICVQEDLRGAELALREAGKTEELVELYKKLHKWEDAIRVVASEAGGAGREKTLKTEYLSFLITTGQEDLAAELQEKEGNQLKALELFLKGGFLLRAYALVQRRTSFGPEAVLRVAGALEHGGLHKEAGELFRRANRGDAAVECLVKGGDFRAALDLLPTLTSMGAGEKEAMKRRLETAWAETLLKNREFEKAIDRFVASGNWEKAVEAAVAGRLFEKVDGLLERARGERAAAEFVTLCLAAGERLKTARRWREAEVALMRSGGRAEKLVLLMYLEASEFGEAARVHRKYAGDELRTAIAGRAKELETAGKWQEAEATFLVASELVDEAIAMRNRQGDFESVLRLVRANKTPEVFAETCKAIGNFFEKRKELSQAEHFYCQGGHWLQAISMYRGLQRWEDAKRVASDQGGRAALEKVCYGQAANEESVEGGVKLLVAQNLPEIAATFAADRRQFELAFELVRKFPEKISDKTHKELLHKRGLALEEQGSYAAAETDLVKAGRAKLAVDMYVHLRDWTAAMRVASEAGDSETAKTVVLAQVHDLVEKRLTEQALEIFQRYGGSPENFATLLLEKNLPDEAFKICRRFNLKMASEVAARLAPGGRPGTASLAPGGGRPATPRTGTGEAAAIEYHFRGERYEEGLSMADKQGVLNVYLAEYMRQGISDHNKALRLAKLLPKFPIKKPADRTLEDVAGKFFRTLLAGPDTADRAAALDHFRVFAKTSNLADLNNAASLASNFAKAKQAKTAPALLARTALSLLRVANFVPVDLALFEAGMAMQEAGKIPGAFFCLNRYLDITDAVEHGMAVDQDDFAVLNLGSFRLPEKISGDVEAAKDLVLDWSVDPSIQEAAPLRPCDKCGAEIFSHALSCSRCGEVGETCAVTGAVLPRGAAKISCPHCGVTAAREDWTEFLAKTRACPSCCKA